MDDALTATRGLHDRTGATGVVDGDRTTLGAEELRLTNAYWRAANYLSVGQIYLYDNPLLREPLTMAHVKPLGNDPGPKLHLRASEPGHQEA
jgi:xylulose-5-phosphate/fructose-6-phosphate phosphoketolase